jgi:hypothetical protein
MARGHSFSDEDPLAAVLAPPPNETAQAREERERMEAEAKRISDEIDEQLRKEGLAMKRRKPTVKVLLLGQSESGALCFSFCDVLVCSTCNRQVDNIEK